MTDDVRRHQKTGGGKAMKVYELVKDHKTGHSKVVSREERGPVDPFSNESIRRQEIGRRSRLASLKSWAVGLRYAWRDRQARMQIVSHVVFFLALLVMPLAAMVNQVFVSSHPDVDVFGTVFVTTLAVGVLYGALLLAHRVFRRK